MSAAPSEVGRMPSLLNRPDCLPNNFALIYKANTVSWTPPTQLVFEGCQVISGLIWKRFAPTSDHESNIVMVILHSGATIISVICDFAVTLCNFFHFYYHPEPNRSPGVHLTMVAGTSQATFLIMESPNTRACFSVLLCVADWRKSTGK